MAAMQEFLDDFGQGKVSGRYVAAPAALPFSDSSFDLPLSSHFLFRCSHWVASARPTSAAEWSSFAMHRLRMSPTNFSEAATR
jgi:hypothetical protein